MATPVPAACPQRPHLANLALFDTSIWPEWNVALTSKLERIDTLHRLHDAHVCTGHSTTLQRYSSDPSILLDIQGSGLWTSLRVSPHQKTPPLASIKLGVTPEHLFVEPQPSHGLLSSSACRILLPCPALPTLLAGFFPPPSPR